MAVKQKFPAVVDSENIEMPRHIAQTVQAILAFPLLGGSSRLAGALIRMRIQSGPVNNPSSASVTTATNVVSSAALGVFGHVAGLLSSYPTIYKRLAATQPTGGGGGSGQGSQGHAAQ